MGDNAITITWVRPDTRLLLTPEYAEAHAGQILCFDLDEFARHDDAADCIVSLHSISVGPPHVVIPCVIALYSVLSDEQTVRLTDAGAFLYEKPRDIETATIISDLEVQIARTQGPFGLFPRAANDEPLTGFPSRGNEAGLTDDLDIFANPPYQLDDTSFERLENRMKMRDSSWQKDD